MTRLPRRLVATLTAATVGGLALAGPAGAHITADAAAAGSGRTVVTLRVAAECGDGSLPTSGLRVQLPEGATDVQPAVDENWTADVSTSEVSWSSTTPPPGPASFVVEMALAQPAGSTVELPSLQQCPNGEELAWIQVPTAPGEQLPFPAPEIVVPVNDTTTTTAAGSAGTEGTSTTVDPAPTTTATMAIEQTPITLEGSDTNTAGLVVFVVIVVVIVGGALVLYLRHRGGRGAGGDGSGTGGEDDTAPPGAGDGPPA